MCCFAVVRFSDFLISRFSSTTHTVTVVKAMLSSWREKYSAVSSFYQAEIYSLFDSLVSFVSVVNRRRVTIVGEIKIAIKYGETSARLEKYFLANVHIFPSYFSDV